MTLDEASGHYIMEVVKFHSRPKSSIQQIKVLLNYFDKTVYLSQISKADISQFIISKQAKDKVKNGTINRYITMLSAILHHANEKWDIKIPAFKISSFKLKEPVENIEYFKSMEDIKKIIECSAAHLKPIIWTALYTGLRRGNILNLKWENIDFERDIITLRVKSKKYDGGKNHIIPIVPPLKDILYNQPQINEYVFNYNGHHITDIKHAWSNALKKANLPHQRFHTLRHTTATWLLKDCKNIKIVQHILGHENVATTNKYAHLMDGAESQALTKLFNK